MKHLARLILIIFLVPVIAVAETVHSTVPNAYIWGKSKEGVKKYVQDSLTEVMIGDTDCYKRSGINVEGYQMDCYYIFGGDMLTSKGKPYKGLSKMVYVLSSPQSYSVEEIKWIYQSYTDSLLHSLSRADSVTGAVHTWERGLSRGDGTGFKIQIGTGSFEKYTKSKAPNVAIVITATELSMRTVRTEQEPTNVPTTAPTMEPSLFALDSSEPGQCGKRITLKSGTDNSYSYYGFFVPAGKYYAKNDSKGACQITFYLNDTEIIDGVEYPKTNSNHHPVVLMDGDGTYITVYRNEYIKLADGDKIKLVRLD